MLRFSKVISAACVAAFLAGCGGGGGSDGSSDTGTTPATTSFPVQQALTYANANGLQKTLNVTGTANNGGTIYPVTGTLTFTKSAATGTTFNNVTAFASTATIVGTLTLNGQSVPFNSSGTDYLNMSYAPIGSAATGAYCVATAPGVYPASATAGETGAVVTYNCYTDSTESTPSGAITQNYVTTAGTNNTLNVTFSTNRYSTTNAVLATAQATYNITSAGVPTLTKYAEAATASGVTLSITAQ